MVSNTGQALVQAFRGFFPLVMLFLLCFAIVQLLRLGVSEHFQKAFFWEKSALVFLPVGAEVDQRLVERRHEESSDVELVFFSASLESQLQVDGHGFILRWQSKKEGIRVGAGS